MKNMAPDTFDRQLVARLQRALEPRREILEAYLFGSRARGDDHGNSDIDVAVYVDMERAQAGQWGYEAELIDGSDGTALGTNDIDVVLLNRAPPLLYHRVLRDGDPAAFARPAGNDHPCRPGAVTLFRLPAATRQNGRRARRFADGRDRSVTPGRVDRRVVDRYPIAPRMTCGSAASTRRPTARLSSA